MCTILLRASEIAKCCFGLPLLRLVIYLKNNSRRFVNQSEAGVTKHRNGPEWAKWTGMRRNGPEWTGMRRNGPERGGMGNRNEAEWTGMNQNEAELDRNNTEMDRNELEWTGITPGWTEMSQNENRMDQNGREYKIGMFLYTNSEGT